MPRNNAAGKGDAPKPAGDEARRVTVLARIRDIALHNWPWKLLSLFLALCVWGALITQDGSLTREKVFADVSVNIVNADTLRRNGYIIVSGLEAVSTVRIKADVPQKVYSTVTSANFNVRVDLSRITQPGEQTLPVTATSSTTFGTVTDISVSLVTVQVEEYISRSRIPVRLYTTGEPPPGFYAESAGVSPAYVTVSGPKSLVNTIVRCAVDYDMAVLTQATGMERTAVPFRLINMKEETVDRALIDVTSESVLLDSLLVEQRLYKEKLLPIDTSGIITGVPAAGYAVKGINVTPESVYLAAEDALLDALTAFPMAECISSPINIDGANGAVRRSVRLMEPTGAANISSDTVLVTILIEPK